LSESDFVVFSPRLFWPRQNIDVVVDGFARLLSYLPRARLLLVKHRAAQNPGYEARIERLMDARGVRPYVRSIDTIPNAEMPMFFSAADVTVSIPDTDGTPMTVMESWACETPVVVQDILDYDPGLFVHEGTVLRIPPRSPEELAAAIVRLARDTVLRERLKQGGIAMVARHADYETEMDRMEQLYEGLVVRQG
jgi:glycosyltransferase involved in cell wall biosynthesis